MYLEIKDFQRSETACSETKDLFTLQKVIILLYVRALEEQELPLLFIFGTNDIKNTSKSWLLV